jgi:hypothetical protein
MAQGWTDENRVARSQYLKDLRTLTDALYNFTDSWQKLNDEDQDLCNQHKWEGISLSFCELPDEFNNALEVIEVAFETGKVA